MPSKPAPGVALRPFRAVIRGIPTEAALSGGFSIAFSIAGHDEGWRRWQKVGSDLGKPKSSRLGGRDNAYLCLPSFFLKARRPNPLPDSRSPQRQECQGKGAKVRRTFRAATTTRPPGSRPATAG